MDVYDVIDFPLQLGHPIQNEWVVVTQVFQLQVQVERIAFQFLVHFG